MAADGRTRIEPRTWVEVDAWRILPGDEIDGREVLHVSLTRRLTVANLAGESFTYDSRARVIVARRDEDCDA